MVIRVSLVQVSHGFHVGHTPFVVGPLPGPQRLDRGQEPLLTIGRRLFQPFFPTRSQSGQDGSWVVLIRCRTAKERVVVTERFSPVGEHKIWVQFLGRLELFDRLFPPEAVEDGHTTQEVLLGLSRFGRRPELERPDRLELCCRWNGTQHAHEYEH